MVGGDHREFGIDWANVLQSKPSLVPHDGGLCDLTCQGDGELLHNSLLEPSDRDWSKRVGFHVTYYFRRICH